MLHYPILCRFCRTLLCWNWTVPKFFCSTWVWRTSLNVMGVYVERIEQIRKVEHDSSLLRFCRSLDWPWTTMMDARIWIKQAHPLMCKELCSTWLKTTIIVSISAQGPLFYQSAMEQFKRYQSCNFYLSWLMDRLTNLWPSLRSKVKHISKCNEK